MPLPTAIPSYTSDPKLVQLSQILMLLLKLSGVHNDDCQRVLTLVESAFQSGYVNGLNKVADMLEKEISPKPLDKTLPAKVN